MPEVVKMAYKLIKYLFRNVDVSKELLHKLINSMDADGNGRISLEEVGIALKVLWKQANGKLDKPKKSRVKTLD